MKPKKRIKNIATKFLGFLWKRGEGSIDDFLNAEPQVGKGRKFLADTAYQLEKFGAVEIVAKTQQGKKVIKMFRLTPRGMLRAVRLHLNKKSFKKLAGERRIIVFDIPEVERLYRDYFRQLMKNLGCRMIQLSVWEADFELPEDFLILIKELGLQNRIIVYRVRPEEVIYL